MVVRSLSIHALLYSDCYNVKKLFGDVTIMTLTYLVGAKHILRIITYLQTQNI